MSVESVIKSSEEGSCAEPCARMIEQSSSSYCNVMRHRDDEVPTSMQQLEAFLADYWHSQTSKRPPDRSKGYTLNFTDIVITRSMVTLLHPLIFCDEVSSSVHDDDNMGTLPGTASNTHSIFSSVNIAARSRFFSQADATTPDHDDEVCTPDDKVRFLSALARSTVHLGIVDSPEIVSELMNTPEIDHLEADCVEIIQTTSLTDLEYIRLGAIIDSSVKLAKLALAVPLANVPQAFCDSFANYMHIQSLYVSNFCLPTTDDQTDCYTFCSMMMPKDCHGPLERLLRNPQNQLKDLFLDKVNLEDDHVMVIARSLPPSHIDKIFLMDNYIQAPGLLELARKFPKMHSLTKIDLSGNPWEVSSLEDLEECGTALLHGLMENPFIQDLDSLDKFPQLPLLWHYLSLNRAGRKILTYAEQPIPDGLWARILSRAGRPIDKGGQSHIPNCDEDWIYNGPANAVYFFLRNCPKLLSWHETSIITSKT